MSTDTETAVPESTPPPSPAPPPSPGAMLRTARERANLSLDELAALTKLARHTLDAMERDDYAALLEPVYVRGYYRKCAKVLDLDEEGLIAAYSSRVSPRPVAAPSKLRLASGTELGSSSRLPVSMALLAAVIAIAVCAFIWFARTDTETYPTVAAPAIGIDTPAQVPLSTVVPTEAPALAPEPTPAASALEQAATEAAEGTGEAPPLPMPSAAASAPGALVLRFEQTSWVRIDDAEGKTLLNDMKRAGAEETVTGAQPLNVFLGNAPGVVVQFQGRTIDTSPFTRSNNTARFSVPQR